MGTLWAWPSFDCQVRRFPRVGCYRSPPIPCRRCHLCPIELWSTSYPGHHAHTFPSPSCSSHPCDGCANRPREKLVVPRREMDWADAVCETVLRRQTLVHWDRAEPPAIPRRLRDVGRELEGHHGKYQDQGKPDHGCPVGTGSRHQGPSQFIHGKLAIPPRSGSLLTNRHATQEYENADDADPNGEYIVNTFNRGLY